LTPVILTANGLLAHGFSLHERYIWCEMTPREKLHLLIDELSDKEAEAALARLVRERELLAQWAEPEYPDAAEDVWALANAREAIREEPW